jgi:hypothetical protein
LKSGIVVAGSSVADTPAAIVQLELHSNTAVGIQSLLNLMVTSFNFIKIFLHFYENLRASSPAWYRSPQAVCQMYVSVYFWRIFNSLEEPLGKETTRRSDRTVARRSQAGRSDPVTR